MAAILALTVKDLLVLVRVKAGLFFTFAWPLIIAVLFGAVYSFPSGGGGARAIPVALADEDATSGSRAFAAALARREAFAVRTCPRRDAIDLVRRGNLAAAVVLPSGFAAAPRVELWLDPSRAAESAMVRGLLAEPTGNCARLAISQHNLAIQQQGPRSGYDITFPQGLIWGVLGCAMTFGIGFVTERTHGTLLRLRTAPIGRAHLLAGKALACALSCLLIEVLLCLIGRFAFHVVPHNWGLLALACVATMLAFVGIMMLLAGLGKSEQAAAGVGWALMMPLSLFGGGMVPLAFMPAWMARIGTFSPVRWSVLALEGALWRGFSPAEMLLPCGILAAIGLLCFAVGAKTLRVV